MLSFNPILSQSTAKQSLKNIRRGLPPNTPAEGEHSPALLVFAAIANVQPIFISLFPTLHKPIDRMERANQ